MQGRTYTRRNLKIDSPVEKRKKNYKEQLRTRRYTISILF